MNGGVRNESDKKDKIIRLLTILFLSALALNGFLNWLLVTKSDNLSVDIPPNFENGGTIKINERQPHILYDFAFNLTQKTKLCIEDCGEEEEANIRKYGYYFTPQYRKKSLKDAVKNQHRNRKRTRTIEEYTPYKKSKVERISSNVWIVNLELTITEKIGNKVVKNMNVKKPVKLVQVDIDRAKNPWRLQLANPTADMERI